MPKAICPGRKSSSDHSIPCDPEQVRFKRGNMLFVMWGDERLAEELRGMLDSVVLMVYRRRN